MLRKHLLTASLFLARLCSGTKKPSISGHILNVTQQSTQPNSESGVRKNYSGLVRRGEGSLRWQGFRLRFKREPGDTDDKTLSPSGG